MVAVTAFVFVVLVRPQGRSQSVSLRILKKGSVENFGFYKLDGIFLSKKSRRKNNLVKKFSFF
jgi:hypothetical protein